MRMVVKRSSSTLARVALIAGSFGIGMYLATLVPSDRAASTAKPAPQFAVADEASADNVQEATAFVQDPPQRTSMRPDFSSGLRRTNQRSNFFMLRAFHDAIGDNWKSTVRVTVEGVQVALGAIVSTDGWIVSKASELPESGVVNCQLFNGDEHAGTVVTRVQELDLALIRIDHDSLIPIVWNTPEIPARGRWLATTDSTARVPAAVGVVSAGALSVKKSNAVLGVHLVDSSDGASVIMVLRGSGAEEAGLQVGDSIFSVNNADVRSRGNFLAALEKCTGGESIKLGVNRADKKFQTEGRLMDLADELLDETEMEVNGKISARATGFSRVFMHDTVLRPNQCGGPLVGLDGKVVGINIARAGRVSSYALPVDVVKPVVEGLIEQAKLVSKVAK